jgi:hypothetical protein
MANGTWYFPDEERVRLFALLLPWIVDYFIAAIPRSVPESRIKTAP